MRPIKYMCLFILLTISKSLSLSCQTNLINNPDFNSIKTTKEIIARIGIHDQWGLDDSDIPHWYSYPYDSVLNRYSLSEYNDPSSICGFIKNVTLEKEWNSRNNKYFYKYTKLRSPLVKGHKYIFSRKAMEYYCNNKYRQLNLGVLFTVNPPEVDKQYFVLSKPQISNKDKPTLPINRFVFHAFTDTFIADANYEWMTIGWFTDKNGWNLQTNCEIDSDDTENTIHNKARSFYWFDNLNLAELIEPKSILTDTLSVYFNLSNPNTTKAELADLNRKLQKYDKFKVVKILVEGFTDHQGTIADNKDLSQKRAEFIKAYLKNIKLQMPILAIGKGINKEAIYLNNPVKQRVAKIIIHYRN